MKNIVNYSKFVNEEFNLFGKKRRDAEKVKQRQYYIEELRKREEKEKQSILDNTPDVVKELLLYIENDRNCIVNAKKISGGFYTSEDFKVILSNGMKIKLYLSSDDGAEYYDYGININGDKYIPLVYEQYKIIREKVDEFLRNTWGDDDESEFDLLTYADE
jgi:hypothetical protein